MGGKSSALFVYANAMLESLLTQNAAFGNVEKPKGEVLISSFLCTTT